MAKLPGSPVLNQTRPAPGKPGESASMRLGIRLMSVLEGRQTQELAAEAFETMLDRWNANWRSSVPKR